MMWYDSSLMSKDEAGCLFYYYVKKIGLRSKIETYVMSSMLQLLLYTACGSLTWDPFIAMHGSQSHSRRAGAAV